MYNAIYALIKEIKEACKCLTVLGGPHVGAFGKKVLEESECDVAVKGEGDWPRDILAQEQIALAWQFGV